MLRDPSDPAILAEFFMQKEVILTPEGLLKLKEELEHLQTDKRREVAERIKEAREFGDISENSEYDDAKNEQAMLEQRIAQLEERLRSSHGDRRQGSRHRRRPVGSEVHVKDDKGKSQTFTIVGSAEAKPPERLSNESPVGKALLGHKKGESVEVSLPNGTKRGLKITKIGVGLQVSDELLAARRAKLEQLRADGIDPFPHAFPGVTAIGEVKGAHAGLEPGTETDARYRVAGRLHARRGQGKMAFLDLDDRSGRLQLQARVDDLGEERMARLLGLDLGDMVGADGVVFVSRRGELSLRVEDFTVLAKSLRPPPEKHHGLTDVETRFRRRELDLIANEEARELFLLRSKAVSAVRRFLDDDAFVEVETPVLQPLYGGALARPFTTHFNAIDRDMYLRIATELYLKRLIVGGLERVYELGKDFRNEGLSFKHNPEFTMLEWYAAYEDYADAARAWSASSPTSPRWSATRATSTSPRRGAASPCARRSSSRPASTSSSTATAMRCWRRPASCSTTRRARGRSWSTTCCPSTSSRP